MQLHQLDSSNWEEELLSIQPIEHASLTLASQDDPNSDIEDEHNSLPSSTEAIQSLHTLMTLIKNQPNQEQLLEKCMNIEADLNHIVLKLKQQKKQTVIGDFFCSV